MIDDKLLRLSQWAKSAVYDETERLALEYAERITFSEQDVDDAFYDTLRARFSEPELVELTAIIGFENFSSKFNHAFQIGGQKFCPLPQPDTAEDGT